MKSIYLFAICSMIYLFVGCQQSQMDYSNNRILLDSLFKHHEVFKAQRHFKNVKQNLPLADSLFYSSKLNYFFNRAAASNADISRLINEFPNYLSEKRKTDLLRLKLKNHVKLFEYRNATNVTSLILEKHPSYLDSMELIDLKNEHILWRALQNQPKQKIVSKRRSVIEMIGGSKIPTFINNINGPVNLIFDTGANISIITKSHAEKRNINFLGSSINVKGIMGNELKAEIGLAHFVKFGNVAVENVVFLVFPDSALYFPQAKFQIEGILGYPVISALEEIQITKKNELIIPTVKTKKAYSNLAMDFLTPLVEVINEGDSLVFTFDTGAGKTWLYEKYYDSNITRIEKNFDKTKIELGGIGLIEQHEIYFVNFPFMIGDQSTELDSVILFTENINAEHNKYYGNFGQDAVKSFDKMTLNFKEMFIKF